MDAPDAKLDPSTGDEISALGRLPDSSAAAA